MAWGMATRGWQRVRGAVVHHPEAPCCALDLRITSSQCPTWNPPGGGPLWNGFNIRGEMHLLCA